MWWKEGIIYEIYLRSFQDTDGDGMGDLNGVTQRLDYLSELGIDIIWITPFYPSPMKDFGYDISDYTSVDPRFGTMQDFKNLIIAAHQRGIKVIIDIVPNHTSDQHPWFKESSSSLTNSKRSWYYWKDARADGSPPNNWVSVLGGTAWNWDNQTNQYYYHAFLKEQPDLNLRNAETFNAVLNSMRFWLDTGVDGFRIDVMWHLAKDRLWRDNPVNPDYTETMPDSDRLLQLFSTDQADVHEVIKKIRALTDEYQDKVILGEIYLEPGRVVTYYGNDDEAHLPANFQLLFTEWKPMHIKQAIDKYEALLPGSAWPNWVIGNHDRPRLIHRIGAGQLRIAAILLLTLRGTPIMYYGDEIGMQQVLIPENEIQDPQGLLMPGRNLSRDPQRTPMQWNSSKNAGFTKGKPWLRIASDFQQNNVENQKIQDDSLLSFYKKLIELRKKEPALNRGDYIPAFTDNKLLSYIRKDEKGTAWLIILNMTDQTGFYNPEHDNLQGKVILSSTGKQDGKNMKTPFEVIENEGLIIRLEQYE